MSRITSYNVCYTKLLREVRFLRNIGADAVGFSTIQEVIAAVHAGIKVLGLSTITNINDPDNPMQTTVDEVIAVANEAVPRLEAIIKNVIGKICYGKKQ